MISLVLSFLIVAFGQSAWCAFLAPCAALFGFALFWKRYRGKFWPATVWYTSVQLVQLSWMTAIEFQGVYILFVWLGLSLWLGLQFGVITLLLKKDLTGRKLLGVASLWVLIEWARLHILCGFSFNPIGLTLAASLQAMQFAALFGILGLSFWVMLINLALLSRRFALWIVLALFPYLFGMAHLSYHDHEIEKKASVALVQTGLLPSEKVLLSGRSHSYISPFMQWQRIIQFLKDEKTHSWDFIILPEAALPFAAEEKIYPLSNVKNILSLEGIELSVRDQEKVSNLEWASSLSRHFNAHMITGLDGKDANNYYAAGYHLTPGEEHCNRYEKRILVPLAEYLPFPWLKPLVASYGILDFFTHGSEAKVFEGVVPFSLSICYEETFSDLMREGRLKGAELFINLTNDNWYPSSRLPEQHFDLGKLRAVENGCPLLRACNSGVTAAVDSLGRTVATFQGKAGVLSTTIDLYSYKTLYTFWGDGGIISLCLFLAVVFVRYKNSKIILITTNHLAQKA